MQPVAIGFTAPSSRNAGSSITEMASTALKEDKSHSLEEEVFTISQPNNTDEEKRPTSGTTHSRSGNTKWTTGCPSNTTGCFTKSFLERFTPTRKLKKAFKGTFVALMFFVFVVLCSLPTILYFTVLVSEFCLL